MDRPPLAPAREPVSSETSIPDLVRRLREDSTHLVGDEVRLAKLELREAAHQTSVASKSFAVAFAAAVIAAVAATVFIATLIGRVAGGHMWLGSIVAAVVDVVAGVMLIKTGVASFDSDAAGEDASTASPRGASALIKSATTAPHS